MRHLRMKTYRIVFADNRGSFAVDAYAHGIGRWYGSVTNYDGEGHDLSFIDVEDDDAQWLEGLMDEDDNVLSYREMDAED